MKKKYESFVSKYNASKDKLSSPDQVDSLLKLWKEYLQSLEQQPLSSYTTKELDAYYKNDELKNDLRLMDQLIYGGNNNINPNEITGFLFDFATKRYIHYLEQVSHVRNDK